MEKNIEKLNTVIDEFLSKEENKPVQEKCKTEECRMKNKDSIIERSNKVYITNDGRQLLLS